MTEQRDLQELLRRAECFANLQGSALELVETRMRVERYEDEAIICEEGAPGDWMFIVKSGEVAVIKRTDAGPPVEIAQLHPGEMGGMLSLFEAEPRSATLKARGPVELWVLDHATFERLLSKDKDLAMGMFAFMSRRMRRDSNLLAKLQAFSQDARPAVGVFDSKPYTEQIISARNQDRFALHFFEHRLSLDTVASAVGFKIICLFVNDDASTAVIDRLADLGVELIALRCAGFNNVDLEACAARGISVVRVPAYSPNTVAEHAVALMMTLNRRVHRAYNRVRDGNFSLNGLVGFEMNGKTAGVIGTGRIGQCTVNILRGFGCDVLAYDMYPNEALAQTPGVTYVELDELLARSDVISVHAPLTPDTHHMIGPEAIAKMKDGVMIINTSRGGLVDTKALIEGLKSGKVGGAGLDVYEEESSYFFEDFSDKHVTDDVLARLLTFNNVVVTSHQAFLTQEALGNIADTNFANIEEFVAGKRGEQLTNAVLPKKA